MLSFLVKSISVSLCLLYLTAIYVDPNGKSGTKLRRMNKFARYVIEKGGKHQVMILTYPESTNESLKINNFIRKINYHVPTLITTIDRATINSEYNRHIGRIPRETTLFVIITFSDTDNLTHNLKKPITLLSKWSHQFTRPKCLIVHFSHGKETNYMKLLKRMWQRKFLDVTLLQLSTNVSWSLNENRFRRTTTRITILHQFNPFSKIYTRQNNWMISSWFPDKGKNLHNQTLNIFKTKVFRVYKFVQMSMASCLNYSIRFVKYSAVKFNHLDQQKVQVYDTAVQYFYTNRERKFHNSRVIHLMPMHVAVPKLYVPQSVNVLSWKLLVTIVVNFLLVVALHGLLMLIKFDENYWRILDIGGIILGMGLPNMPKSMRERIVLCCLLLMCTIYSGYLHSLLTDLELRPATYQEIRTLQDLADSNLPLQTTVKNFLQYETNEPGYLKKLKNRTEKIHYDSVLSCLDKLITYKNVSCSAAFNVINFLINKHRKLHRKLELKIIGETLSYRGTIFFFETAFSITDNFNKKLLQFIETGLMSKWKLYDSKMSANSWGESLNDTNLSEELLMRVLVLVFFGYSLAFVAFNGEILWNYFTCKRRFRVIET